MGADGGVIYIALRNPSDANYMRCLELLKPFWQFLCTTSCSDVSQDANWEWQKNNPDINSPKYLLGYYGTDRVDNFDLHHLAEICQIPDSKYFDVDEHKLFSLTFDELDLECRTSNIQDDNGRFNSILHDLWYQHFKSHSREQVLLELGPLSNMKIEDWASELCSLLWFDAFNSEETWT